MSTRANLEDERGGSGAPREAPPTILALHGFLSGRASWRPLRRELGGEVRLVAPDLLGHGRAPRPGGEYSLERVVEHLAPIVERARPSHVVGHSMGAIVALALAQRYPGRFRRIGLIGLPVFDSRAAGIAHFHHRGFVRRVFVRADGLSHTACRAAQIARPLWLPLRPLYAPDFPAATLRAAFDHSRQSHSGSFRAILFAGLTARLAEGLGTPVATLHGGHDRAAPIAPVRELAARYGWDLCVAPEANHHPQIMQPALAARWLREHVLR